MMSSLGKPFNIYSFSINLEVYTCTQKCQKDDSQCSGTLNTCMDNQCKRIKAKQQNSVSVLTATVQLRLKQKLY